MVSCLDGKTWKVGSSFDSIKQLQDDARKYPHVRAYQNPQNDIFVDEPQKDCNGKWLVLSEKTASEFSGVQYFFAARVYDKIGVPIGLLDTSRGAQPIESYLPNRDVMLAKHPELRDSYDAYSDFRRRTGRVGKTKRAFNALVAPIAGYTIRGMLWYQGESNGPRKQHYGTIFPIAIKTWRELWGQGEFPLFFVQLHATPGCVMEQPGLYGNKAVMREHQLNTLRRAPNTAMAVAVDTGYTGPETRVLPGHPPNKRPVGERLAALSLNRVYGFTDIACQGPLYASHERAADRIIVRFHHINAGLVAKGETLTGFEIRDANGKWHSADAEIRGETVAVTAPSVECPDAVRYGWANPYLANLYDGAGFPAATFRTDSEEVHSMHRATPCGRITNAERVHPPADAGFCTRRACSRIAGGTHGSSDWSP
ncbi:MAG: hypothetical protein JXR37_23480 [Kiritimatiellae bacterium]|nr:hypothetical protein [Kiritimatiellia bacterium]